ncbi:MAG: hypothetical protein ACPG4Z_08450 [Chitinophagales bacterium]
MKQLLLFISLLLTLSSFGQNEIEDKEQLLEEYYKQYEEIATLYQHSFQVTDKWLQDTSNKLDSIEDKIIVLENHIKIESLYEEYCKEYDRIAMIYQTSPHEAEWWLEKTANHLHDLEEKIKALEKEIQSEEIHFENEITND